MAFGRTLREQQKEEIIKSEIEDGIKRLGKRTPVSLTTMMGPNLHIIFAGSRAEFAKKVNNIVVGTCSLNGRQACAELRLNLLGDNPCAPFEKVQENRGLRELLEYRSRWRHLCAYTKGYIPNPGSYPVRWLTSVLLSRPTV